MLHSFIYQLLLSWVQGAGTVVAVCLKMINKSWFCDKSPKNFDLRFFSHQDWILRCVALLNLAWHLRFVDKVVWENEKANCNNCDYQCERKRPLHPNTVSVLFTSQITQILFISLTLWQWTDVLEKRCQIALEFNVWSLHIAISLETVEQRVIHRLYRISADTFVGPQHNWQVGVGVMEYIFCTA